eukprot:UN30970
MPDPEPLELPMPDPEYDLMPSEVVQLPDTTSNIILPVMEKSIKKQTIISLPKPNYQNNKYNNPNHENKPNISPTFGGNSTQVIHQNQTYKHQQNKRMNPHQSRKLSRKRTLIKIIMKKILCVCG